MRALLARHLMSQSDINVRLLTFPQQNPGGPYRYLQSEVQMYPTAVCRWSTSPSSEVHGRTAAGEPRITAERTWCTTDVPRIDLFTDVPRQAAADCPDVPRSHRWSKLARIINNDRLVITSEQEHSVRQVVQLSVAQTAVGRDLVHN